MSGNFLSLICATKGRHEEVARLITSLENQSVQNFELIIVDQNPDDLLLPLISVQREFSVTHIKLSKSGNTHARNVGVEKAKGNWVSFPDDDSWYSDTLIDNIYKNIDLNKDADGFFVNWTDPNSGKKMFEFTEGQMVISDAFSLISCICLFLKKESVQQLGGFNEKLGIGDSTLIKAGEEQDLMLRMISRSMKLFKLPKLEVHHEIGTRKWNDAFEERIMGQGACDYYFTRKYIGPMSALQLRATWMMGYLYNVLRGNAKNASWYRIKLRGVSLSSKIG